MKELKLLFVGDSHVGAIRRAINDDEALAALAQFDWFAHTSRTDVNLGQIECTDGSCGLKSAPVKLVHKGCPSGRFFPDTYDGVILVGLRTELPYLLWSDFYWEAEEEASGKYHVSAETYQLALGDYIERQALALVVARKIRSVSKCRMVLIPNPYLGDAARQMPVHTAAGILPAGHIIADRIVRASGKLRDWKSVLQSAFAVHRVDVVFQPDETIADSIFTRREYITGDTTPRELRHMNSRYGRIVVRRLVQMLS